MGDRLMESFAFRHVTPPLIWKGLRLVPLEIGNEGQIKRDIRVINAFSDRVLDSRQAKTSNISDESGDKYNDVISLFSKHDKTLTRNQLKYIAMNMIIAGRDTTRLILSWCLYELCKRPDIKQNVYNEIDEFIKTNKCKEIGYDQIGHALKYTESTLLETLRMNPVVPWLVRHAMEDVQLPNGNIIREGNEVIVPTYIYARNPNIYDDPLKFDPNRYYNKGKEPIMTHDVYKYPFFNINPRLCLGRKLALMESKVFLFYFCQQYDFEMIPNQNIKIKTGLVLNMVDGLRLKLTKR